MELVLQPDKFKTKTLDVEIGDYIQVGEEVFQIIDFCTCDKCCERGVFEPLYFNDKQEVEYITNFYFEKYEITKVGD